MKGFFINQLSGGRMVLCHKDENGTGRVVKAISEEEVCRLILNQSSLEEPELGAMLLSALLGVGRGDIGALNILADWLEEKNFSSLAVYIRASHRRNKGAARSALCLAKKEHPRELVGAVQVLCTTRQTVEHRS